MPNRLLVGFDSAWNANRRGAVAGAVQFSDGSIEDLGIPRLVNFAEAGYVIREWQERFRPHTTLVLIDQPIIVKNAVGQRPVENLVATPVGRRRGGVQPASTRRTGMFGPKAGIWSFLSEIGTAADPSKLSDKGTFVLETYPVLALISMGWLQARPPGGASLPKYNPERKTFSQSDWSELCNRLADEFRRRGMNEVAAWLAAVSQRRPTKGHQDGVDACICLVVAMSLASGRDGLMVGDMQSGYMVVPGSPGLREELEARCVATARSVNEWIRTVRLPELCSQPAANAGGSDSSAPVTVSGVSSLNAAVSGAFVSPD